MKTITVPNPLGKSPGNKVYGYGYMQGSAAPIPTWTMLMPLEGYYPQPTVGYYHYPTPHSECTLTRLWG